VLMVTFAGSSRGQSVGGTSINTLRVERSKKTRLVATKVSLNRPIVYLLQVCNTNFVELLRD
jgi:hypothetical protein